MNQFKYVGTELDLFAAVCNWKSYWSRQVRPFLGGDVLEVGAGLGSNTRFLDIEDTGRWVCLEPDPELAAQLERNLKQTKKKHRAYDVVCGTLKTLPAQQFDTIVYIDVLEHIEDDRDELNTAASYLAHRGCLVVLCPAHQRLFTAFDASVGHFRRYNRSMLRNISPTGLQLERMRYLDCAGMLASAANLVFLNQSMPSKSQLGFWDHCMVPISRVLDKLVLYSVGKSILAIWRKR
jgi:SAM-dependent methyltransferase